MINEDISKFFEDDDFSEDKINDIMKNIGLDLKYLEEQFDNYHPTRDVKYEVTNEDAVEPGYNYPSDSGFDLYSIIDGEIEPFGRLLVPTGFNTSKEKIKIHKGMKIAQAVLSPVINGDWVTLTRVESVDKKDRDENGFGSTGI